MRQTDFPKVVLLGDSHALMWAGILDEILESLNVSASYYAADADNPFLEIPITEARSTPLFGLDEKLVFDTKRLEFLELWKPKLVFIGSAWMNRSSSEMADLIAFLGSIESHVIFIEQPPPLYFGDKNAPQYLSFLNFIPQAGVRRYIGFRNSEQYQNGRKLIREISRTCDYCDFIPVADLFIAEGDQAWVLDGFDVLYIDDDHLSEKGARKAAERIIEKLVYFF